LSPNYLIECLVTDYYHQSTCILLLPGNLELTLGSVIMSYLPNITIIMNLLLPIITVIMGSLLQ